MRNCASWICAGLVLVACQTPQVGFEAARGRLGHGDLIGALVELDRVPPADPNYAEARSLAAAVERRIRTSQRLFARGLALRAQWRDDEAIENFELARQVWPRVDGVEALIAATRHRMNAVSGAPQSAAVSVGDVARTRPVEDPLPDAAFEGADDTPVVLDDGVEEPVSPPVAAVAGDDPIRVEESGVTPESASTPAAPSVETSPQTAVPGSLPEAPRADAESPEVPSAGVEAVADVTDPMVLRVKIANACAALRAGRLDDAFRDLEQLHRRHGDVREISELWSRVLHQRALLAYGQGDLAVAVETWRRLLDSDPSHRQAREFLDAARSELEAQRRR